MKPLERQGIVFLAPLLGEPKSDGGREAVVLLARLG